MRRNSTYSVSPSLKTLLCEVPALGVEHTAWPGWLSQEQSREQSTGRGPRQMLLLGELLGSGLWSRGIGIWSRLPSASSRPGSSQGSDPGRGSPFLPRALAHAQPHLESLLPPSLWMETLSAASSWASLLWGHVGSGRDKLVLTRHGPALPEARSHCPSSVPGREDLDACTAELVLDPGEEGPPGWHQRRQHTHRHLRDSSVDRNVRIC